MTTQNDLKIKNEILKCSSICGGLAGNTLRDLNCPEHVIRELCETRRLKKGPVQILGAEGMPVRLTFYEDQALARARRNYTCMTAPIAEAVWLKNRFYLANRDIAQDWFDDASIDAYCKEFANGTGTKDKPNMMLYTAEGLVGVYFCKAKKALTEEEKAERSQKYMLDKCVVCVSH